MKLWGLTDWQRSRQKWLTQNIEQWVTEGTGEGPSWRWRGPDWVPKPEKSDLVRGARQERGRRGLHSGAAEQRAGVRVQQEVSRRGGWEGGGCRAGRHAPASVAAVCVCVCARPTLRLNQVPSVGCHSYPDDTAQVWAECTVGRLVCPGPQTRDARGHLGIRSWVCF